MKTTQDVVSLSKDADIPHITANELCKYVFADDAERRSILKSQKKPNKGAITHYSVALPLIRRGLSCGFAGAAFEARLHALTKKWIPTTRGLTRQSDNIAAVSLCREIMPALPIEKCTLLRDSAGIPKGIVIAGVSISVRPDVLITCQAEHLAEQVGAIKLYLSKNRTLDVNQMTVGSVLLHKCMVSQYGDKVSRHHCLMLDVFARKYLHTPDDDDNAFALIEEACCDIARRWPSVVISQPAEREQILPSISVS